MAKLKPLVVGPYCPRCNKDHSPTDCPGAPAKHESVFEKKRRVERAAPALLEACKEALWACSGKEYDPDRFQKAVELCRAALAKAGEHEPFG